MNWKESQRLGTLASFRHGIHRFRESGNYIGIIFLSCLDTLIHVREESNLMFHNS